MNIPEGVDASSGEEGTYFKLQKILYGFKLNWFKSVQDRWSGIEATVLSDIRGWLYLSLYMSEVDRRSRYILSNFSWSTRETLAYISECRNQALRGRIIRPLSTTSYITRILHLPRSDETDEWKSSTNSTRVTSDQITLLRVSEGDGRRYSEKLELLYGSGSSVPSPPRLSDILFPS